MASSGRLLLLLLLCTVTVSAAPNKAGNNNPEKVKKFKIALKATGKFMQENAASIKDAILPLIEFIPIAGPYLSAIVNVALLGAEMSKEDQVLAAVRTEFQSLNFKLDEQHMQQEWNSWAGGAYHKPEKKIRDAWKEYQIFLSGLPQARDDDQKKKLVNHFIQKYEKFEGAMTTLHTYLTISETSLINNLAKDLAKHLKCHEKEIRQYTVLISQLMYMANTMNHVYYGLKDTLTDARIKKEAEMTYEAAAAMFEVEKTCIINSTDYIRRDVEELMAGTKKEDLAKKVRSKLVEMYDRYDWMVVAFITKNSQHKVVETRNHHVMKGFEEVTKDKVTVAVARQVKGTHSLQKAKKIKEAIEKCFKETVLCYKVVETLDNCKESVDGLPVTKTYSAVHAFTRESHGEHETKEVPDEVFANPEESGNIPYIYTGKCERSPRIKKGKFIVLMKSDEELKAKDSCSGVNCGGPKRGQCVPVKGVFIGMCECKQPYYGKNCEESLEEYIKFLKRRSVTIDKNGEVTFVVDVSDLLPKKPK